MTDLTRRAIERWVAALRSDWFDVRLVHAVTGQGIVRRYTAPQFLRSLRWLRAMNATEYHVYSRPFTTQHVLVDDLNPDAVDRLRVEHAVAALVETSPWNFQAWITIGSTPVSPAVAREVARMLAAGFGGDLRCVGRGQLGRAPGFTNRKDVYESAAGFPFVVLRHASARVTPTGAALVATAKAAVAKRRQAEAAPKPSPSSASSRAGTTRRSITDIDPALEYERRLEQLRACLGEGVALDRSRADFAIARRLLMHGFAPDDVGLILAHSDKAGDKGRRAQDYVARTIGAARSAIQRLAD